MGKISDALEKIGQSTIQEPADHSDAPFLEPVDLKSIEKTVPQNDRPPSGDKLGQEKQIDTESVPSPQYSESHSKIHVSKIRFPQILKTHFHKILKSRRPRSKDVANKLVAFTLPHSYEAEQFRLLRTNIMFPAEGRKSLRSIMITSTHPGDGKSFVASNLAVTISQNIDRHVLLVDCDLRKPSINHIFGLSDRLPGLSEHLNEGTPLSRLIVRTATPRLSILPGGLPPPNPSELLSSNRMSALTQELLERYHDRYVIIDSPPPQVAAESAALAKYVEGIILVIKIGHTDKDAAAQVVEKLGKEKIIGVVANRLTRRAVGYFGAGHYDQYYHYRNPTK